MTGLYVASNPTALTAQFNLIRNMSALTETLTRLSTGLKINSGKDDPAGLIASELLKADITGTNKAITNTQRANSMIATADSAMGQIGNLLNDIKGLVVEGANDGAMSTDQIAANQLQINASIDAIDRIAKSTTYAGNKLLDGSMDFSTDAAVQPAAFSGVKPSNISITSANFGTASSVGVNVHVQEAARRGTLIYNGTGVDQTTTMNITGSTGTETFKFGAGISNAEIVNSINSASDSTGVQAFLEGAASRGTIQLNGVGANNGLVITANDNGYDNGNYTFRIVKGEKNDAYVVSEPNAGQPGIIEVSLEETYETTYTDFAGLFDITLGTGNESAATAVSITRGTTNQAYLADADANANAISQDGKKTLNVTSAGTGGAMSSVNGWTFKMVDANADGQAVNYDDDAKVAYIVAANYEDNTEAAVQRISGGTTAGTVDYTGDVAVGDEFTLSGGAAAGGPGVHYKEGSTINDILKLMNENTGVQASLATGVNGDAVMPALIGGRNSRETRDSSAPSKFTSNVTAAEVLELINRKLGDRFTAQLATGETGTGRMTYMDAAVDSGSVNMDNAIRFSGMDHGPIIRMVTMNSEGVGIPNQKLSVQLVNPTETDRANGITTPILQINLATDGSGNSITTAADIVELFNTLTPEQTGGISASLILPDGVDPNGRTWVTDECGNMVELTDCSAQYGLGIVQPTGVAGTCEIQENDLVLLGMNQSLVADNAVAYGRNSAPSERFPPWSPLRERA